MKALLFGAGGQVGSALAAAAPGGWDVAPLDRAACDVGDRSAVEAAIADGRADLVINATGYTAVDRAEGEPERAALINAASPGWMAAAARAAGARFIHFSTDFVFDGAAGMPYAPNAATNPLSTYGRTKRDGEHAVLAANDRALIVRTAWVYSPAGANFVRTMLRLMRERGRVTVVADQVGTPTSARSLAEATWALAASEAEGIHHFTDAGVASWFDFAVAIAEEATMLDLLPSQPQVTPIATADYPTPARRPACSVLDKRATWALLGGPALHWRHHLRDCLREIAGRG